MGMSVELHWGLGQEDLLEESREAEALRRRSRRPRLRRGMEVEKVHLSYMWLQLGPRLGQKGTIPSFSRQEAKTNQPTKHTN